MSLRDRLEKKKQQMLEQIQRGKERTEQQRAEKLRKKHERITTMKPGARKAITEGLAMKKKPWEVARDEYERRKQARKEKYHRK